MISGYTSGQIVSPRPIPQRIGSSVLSRSVQAVAISTSVNPTGYAIELRDKDFNLKARLEQVAVNVSWEWNRLGGCGRCTFVIKGDYLMVNVQPDDDVRVYLPNSNGTSSTLWYRGYVESVTPSISGGNDGEIRVECAGYVNWLDRVIVQNAGDLKTYSNQETSLIVQSIIETFVEPYSPIVAGTIQASNLSPDTLQFKDTAKNCIRTLFDLIGTVEYGVDADLNFFWYNQSETIVEKFWLGGNIVKLSDKVDFKELINYIFLEGGDVGGAAFLALGGSTDSIERYGRHEAIVSNGSIVTSAVSSQYISSILNQRGKPTRQLSVSMIGITRRFEATRPMGAYSIIDGDAVQNRALYGTTANGGSNKLYGTRTNGGSNQLYGGFRKEQIDRVIYSINPENGKVDAEVQFGGSLSVSKASASIKQIELIQSALRQRSL